MAGSIDKFGRVVIPKELRDSLGLEPGTPVEFHEKDGKIVLECVPERVELVRKGHALVFPGRVMGDTTRGVQKVREERMRKFFPKAAPRE